MQTDKCIFTDSPWNVLADAQDQWLASATMALISSVKQGGMQKLAATRKEGRKNSSQILFSDPIHV